MPMYFFWGDDDFTINEQITTLKQDNLDPNWLQFNFHKFSGTKDDSIGEALLEVMTPPFGSGDRVILVLETTIGQACSEDLLKQLQRTLPTIPANSHFVLTSKKKPNGRLKSSKLINQYAQVKEFSLIPPWQTDALIHKVEEVAQQKAVKLTKEATKILANCVGNNSLLLWQELEKLAIYQGKNPQPLDEQIIKSLVNVSNQNSLQLAEAILLQNVSLALQLVKNLLNLNEPPLRIVATLVGQFRTWAIVKTMLEAGEKDEQAIAKVAEIHNPKRIYFLKKQVQKKSAQKLPSTLPILLELEANLKLGADPLATMEIKIIELCNV